MVVINDTYNSCFVCVLPLLSVMQQVMGGLWVTFLVSLEHGPGLNKSEHVPQWGENPYLNTLNPKRSAQIKIKKMRRLEKMMNNCSVSLGQSNACVVRHIPVFVWIWDGSVQRLQLTLRYNHWVACVWHQHLFHLEYNVNKLST